MPDERARIGPVQLHQIPGRGMHCKRAPDPLLGEIRLRVPHQLHLRRARKLPDSTTGATSTCCGSVNTTASTPRHWSCSGQIPSIVASPRRTYPHRGGRVGRGAACQPIGASTQKEMRARLYQIARIATLSL